MNNSFYRAFEERYRGSRELIKSRLKVYIPFVMPLVALHKNAVALDLGCGRGEWLELMTELGFNANGVDIDAGMLAACHERGLHVREADAITTLRELPSESMAVISAFHVVEHIPFDGVQKLLEEALRALVPGGLLILETPNPGNLVVSSTNFYLDPSHTRPIPSELLSFATEHAGFHRNKILLLQEASELRNSKTVGLFDVLNGVSPDYGLVAQKEASSETLTYFDDAFRPNYGISLIELAQRYDSLFGSRVAAAEARSAHIETQLNGARVEMQQLQMQVHALQVQMQTIQASIYWRVYSRLRTFAKRTASWVTKHAISRIKRNPTLTRWARSLYARFPGLGQRMLYLAKNSTSGVPKDQSIKTVVPISTIPSAWGGDIGPASRFKAMVQQELQRRIANKH